MTSSLPTVKGIRPTPGKGGCGDLVRIAAATGGDRSGAGLDVGRRHAELAMHRGYDGAGVDGVHADAALDQLAGERAGERGEPRLRRGANVGAGHADSRIDRGVEHDRGRI